MRRVFTSAEAYENGITPEGLRYGVRTGRWVRVAQGIYVEGNASANELEAALAILLATGGVVSGSLAGVLYDLDSVRLKAPFVALPRSDRKYRHGISTRELPRTSITEVDGFRCATGLQTMLDLASVLTDRLWEQALESALRKKLLTLDEVDIALKRRRRGNQRIRRVLNLRPPGAPPTESLLETLMVQLIRDEPLLPEPTRQHVVLDSRGEFVARIDLSWPKLGIFVELDGEQHKGQPRYDANRQTRVVVATGWLPARYTWTDVKGHPKSTTRSLLRLLDTSTKRPA